jgi:SRSO17 transposase
MEPIAARLDPEHVQARYASIQRLSTDSEWDYQALLNAIRDYCLPLLIAKPALFLDALACAATTGGSVGRG